METRAYFSCNEHQFSPSASLAICLTSGNWDQQDPICVRGDDFNRLQIIISINKRIRYNCEECIPVHLEDYPVPNNIIAGS